MMFSRHTLSMKKIVVVVAMAIFVSLSPVAAPSASAYIAWPDIINAQVETMLENIQISIRGALLASLKSAAIQMLSNQVNKLLGGKSGEPLVISNFKSFIYASAMYEANVYMNDFFSTTTRGKYATANWLGVGDPSGMSQGYAGYLVAQARQATTESSRVPVYNLDEFGSPDQIFARGDWRGLNSMISNPANNVFGYSLMAENAYQNALTQNIQSKITQSQSSGFLGVQKNGQIITPAQTVGDVVTSVKTMGNQVITSAENPGELLGGAISGIASNVLNQLLNQGVSMAQNQIQSQLGRIGGPVGSFAGDAIRQAGSGVLYNPQIRQQAAQMIPSFNQANSGFYDP